MKLKFWKRETKTYCIAPTEPKTCYMEPTITEERVLTGIEKMEIENRQMEIERTQMEQQRIAEEKARKLQEIKSQIESIREQIAPQLQQIATLEAQLGPQSPAHPLGYLNANALSPYRGGMHYQFNSLANYQPFRSGLFGV